MEVGSTLSFSVPTNVSESVAMMHLSNQLANWATREPRLRS
jgi:hypothetical protein